MYKYSLLYVMPWGEEKKKISTVKQSLCLTIKEIYVEYVQQNMVGHLTFQIIFFHVSTPVQTYCLVDDKRLWKPFFVAYAYILHTHPKVSSVFLLSAIIISSSKKWWCLMTVVGNGNQPGQWRSIFIFYEQVADYNSMLWYLLTWSAKSVRWQWQTQLVLSLLLC